MPKYIVNLTFKYSDKVNVEAEDEKEALTKALEQCDEQYECFYDSSIQNADEIIDRMKELAPHAFT